MSGAVLGPAGLYSISQLELVDNPTRIAEARTDPSDPADRSAVTGLRRGALLGRYVVLEKIGAGGMGVVYAAYDPQLDRRVALKLLHDERGEVAEARLHREAQAMASLSHPHVVTVHDVGIEGARVFVAMELIDGQTFSAWLHARTPDVDDILQACIDAGQGLAAAHAAGLVHRDFKPDNVMVAADGRIVVMDFGLAREPHPAHLASGPQGDTTIGSGSESLTQTGALIGTPAYMSPEQLQAGAVDARSDQFAFCVTAWEALFGKRPFGGSSVAAVRSSVESGAIVEPPAKHGVPVPVVEALRRGLSVEPSERYPSMHALLAAFESRPPTRRRVAILGGLVGVGVFGTAAATFDAAADSPCDAAEQHVARVWDEARLTTIAQAFATAGGAVAESRWTATRGRFDAWLSRWTDAHVAVCQATHVHHEQTASTLEDRMDCLQDDMFRIDAALDELVTVDAELIWRASNLADQLPDPQRCRTLKPAVEGRGVRTAGQRVAVERARRARAVATTRLDAGRFPGLLQASEDGLEALDGIEAPALRSDLLDHRAAALRRLGRVEEAVATLREGLALAQEAGLPRSEAALWLTLIEARGIAEADTSEALALLLPAELATRRARVPRQRIALEDLAGRVLVEHGQAAAAIPRFVRALETIESEGAEPGVAANVHNDLGVALSHLGRFDEALQHHRLAAADKTERWGAEHPFVASALMNVGRVLEAKGDLAGARENYDKALAIREEIYGPEHPDVADVLVNLGTLAADHGERGKGREALVRAQAIYQRALSPGHPRLGLVLDNLAIIARADGRLDEALESCDAALAILRQSLGAEHPELLMTRATRASILADLGRHPEALATYRALLAIHERVRGPDDIEVAFALMGLSQSALAMGDLPEAVAAAARALTVVQEADVEPGLLATAQFVSAAARGAARRAEGLEPVAARALALEARAAVAAEGPTPNAELVAEIDAWFGR